LLPLISYSLSIDITEEGSDDSDDEDFEPSLNFTLRFVMLFQYVSVVTYILCLSLHRMGLLPDLTMDNAAGLRLSINPSEAYGQISDCCHK
jgi:hypothetical protein